MSLEVGYAIGHEMSGRWNRLGRPGRLSPVDAKS